MNAIFKWDMAFIIRISVLGFIYKMKITNYIDGCDLSNLTQMSLNTLKSWLYS